MKWDYCVKECETGRYYDAFCVLILEPLGREGWELFHITERPVGLPPSDDTVSLKGYFKRPVTLRHD